MNQIIVYYNAYHVVLRMMRDRGYIVPLHYFSTNLEQFEIKYKTYDMYNDSMDIMGISGASGASGAPEDVYVTFTHSFSVMSDKNEILARVAAYLNNLNGTNVDNKYVEDNKHIIIIYNNLTNRVNRIINSYEENYDQYSHIELFDVNRLSIDPINHIYQPRFRLIKKDTPESKEIIDSYETSISKMPIICRDDPVNKYYFGKPNDIYEITRHDGTIFYRIVTNKLSSAIKKQAKK